MYYTKPINWNREVLAYLVGVALGDGNLSSPNGRVARLRISCDLKYPFLITEIIAALNYIFPESKIDLVPRKGCVDISVYSNHLETILGWSAKGGSKFLQNATIPNWIYYKDEYMKACLKGLIETDGSIYYDRGYPMIMFTNIVQDLAKNVFQMMRWFGFWPRIYSINEQSESNRQKIYHVRLSRDVNKFLNLIQPVKA